MIELSHIGEQNGLPIYAPTSGEDVKALEGMAIVRFKLATPSDVRTTKQNSSLHKYWEMLANDMNDAGITRKAVLEARKNLEISWTPEAVGDWIWRDYQEALIGHRRTSKLKKKQLSDVAAGVGKWLSEKLRITTPFPTWRYENDCFHKNNGSKQ